MRAGVGRLSRSKRAARRGGAPAPAPAGSAAGRPAAMTLMSLAELITKDLVRTLPGKDGPPDDGRGPVFQSVCASIVFEGKRRKVRLPVDMFNASRDMQQGCIYGYLARMTRSKISVCLDCGKVEQDMFVFDGSTLVKVPHRKADHGR